MVYFHFIGFRGSENGDGSQGGDGESNPSVGA